MNSGQEHFFYFIQDRVKEEYKESITGLLQEKFKKQADGLLHEKICWQPKQH